MSSSHRPRSAIEAITRCAAVAGAALATAVTLPAGASAATAPRGYEQVTPADKDYGFGQTNQNVAISGPTGDTVAFNTYGPMPGATSGNLVNFSLARRGAGGWTSRSVTPPQEPTAGGTTYPIIDGFSGDLSSFSVATANPVLAPAALPGVGNLYRGSTADGHYDLLTPYTSAPTNGYNLFAGASDDFSHVVVQANDPLAPGGPATGFDKGLYEWVGGTVRNVGVLPDGTPTSNGLLGADPTNNQRTTHAVSADGSRIVFTDTNAAAPQDAAVYVRENGISTTVASASQRTVPDPNASPAIYAGASTDGSRVFFTSARELTDDATTGDDGSGNATDAGNDLYMYNMDDGRLTDLTVDTNPADLSTGAAVQGMVGASDDGSYVYFVALGALTPSATSGVPNLYVRHGAGVRLIGALDFADTSVWSLLQTGGGALTSQITPDGGALLFQSQAPLAGYDNTDATTGSPHVEVYRYTFADDRLVCASCRPDGTRPTGSANLSPAALRGNPPRNITPDASEVFFDTTDTLVARDTNGKQDVYEYTGGRPQLVSTGTDRNDATFQNASADGDDVFFSTAGRLVGQDFDDHVDLYDARVGGGFPPPPVPPAPCDGDGCAPPPTIPPASPVAATVTFTGAANPPLPHLLRGRVTVSRTRTIRGARTTLKVKVNAKGTLKVSGSGVRSVTARPGRAQTVSVRLSLTGSAARTLARHGRKRVRTRIAFTPSGGTTVSATVTLTFTAHKKGRA
jgi:hypothetical protein